MSTENIKKLSSNDLMKLVLQRIATGPELSKNISREEAKLCMDAILNDEIEEVRSDISEVDYRVDNADSEIDDLKNQLSDLRDEIESVYGNKPSMFT